MDFHLLVYFEMIAASVYAVSYIVFLARLKKCYPKQWELLGKPGLIINNTFSIVYGCLRFIMSEIPSGFATLDKLIVWLVRISFTVTLVLLFSAIIVSLV